MVVYMKNLSLNTNKINVILLTLDSVRFDHLSLFGYKKPTTPTLSRICKEYASICTVARANAPYTKASFKSIMTGLLPFTHGGYDSIKGLSSIAKTLNRYKYKCFGIANNDVISHKFGYNEGFDWFITLLPSFLSLGNNIFPYISKKIRPYIFERKTLISHIIPRIPKSLKALFLSIITYGRSNNLNPSIPAHAIAAAFSKFLKFLGKEHFFIWTHFMDTHYPYVITSDFYEEIHGEKPNKYSHFLHYVYIIDHVVYNMDLSNDILISTIMFYDAAIRTVDDAISRVVNKLEESNLLNKTLLIITSDHGEEFLEHCSFGHLGKKFITHMYEELLKVPLIIIDFSDKILNKWLIRKLRDIEWSHIDLYPSLCKLLGLKHPRSIDGLDLVSIATKGLDINRAIISEASLFNFMRGIKPILPDEKIVIAIKEGSWKYINYDNYAEELYNLDQDSAEVINLAKEKNYKSIISRFQEIANRRLTVIKSNLLRYHTKRVLYRIKARYSIK